MKKGSVLLALVSVLISSCNEVHKKTFSTPDSHTYTYDFKPIPDTILPPEILELNAVNAPRSFVIKPKTVPLKYPSGVGGFSVTKYGAAENLRAINIQDLAIDLQGNIWVGGLGSLSKFDGTTFTNFSTPNGGGNLFVSQLLVDSEGTLWIGSLDNTGLYKYDGKFFKPVPLLPGKNESIDYLLEGLDGDIWAAGSKGLYRVRKDSVTRYGVEHGLPDDRIRSLLLSPNNEILIFTIKGNSLFDGKRFMPYTEIPILNAFPPAIKDSNGHIWFLIYSEGKYQLGRFDGKRTAYFSEEQGLFDPVFVHRISLDQKGNIWVVAQNALFLLHQGRFTKYPIPELGLPRKSNIIEDPTGNIWMGTSDGLIKLNTGLVHKIEVPQIEAEQSFPQLNIGNDGTKSVILNHTLIQYDQTIARAYELKSALGDNISKIYTAKNGHIWLTIGEGSGKKNLIQFDGDKFLKYNDYKHYTQLDFIQNISEDPAGNLVFTGLGGITLFNGKQFTHYGQRQGMPNYVHRYLIDSKQRKWLGTEVDGAWVFTEDSVLHLNIENGLKHNFINDLAEDPFGNVWLATDKGVYRFDGIKLISVGSTEGLESIVGGLNMNTADSLLWIGNVNGLYKLPFSEINSPSPKPISYSPYNGYEFIPSIIAIQQRLQSDSVGLWMELLTGNIVRFNYKNIREFKPPVLALKNIRINNSDLLWSLLSKNGGKEEDSLMYLNESALKFGKAVDLKKIDALYKAFGNIHFDSLRKEGFIPENLELPFDNNSISFEYAAISPSFGKYTQYRYKLDGYNKNWSPLSHLNEAYFGNMGPGSYTFHLEAITSFGTTSTLSYHFKVLPPWYRTWWAYLTFVLMAGAAVYVFIRWRTQALQKDKLILEHKINIRTTELKESLESLKSTQSQLIQAEKMASLGELTAGIAHEIQNPLNFVNNFSEVNRELAEELEQEIDKGNYTDAKAIAKDIKDNEEKISEHGKRADAIVKGMLQHSRSSSGVKEPTDINALADEYLRLAYHGLRAKDKSFNATIKTDFDQNISKIMIIPQDIGRVLLNLINNAFYAANERSSTGDGDYQPIVQVSTRREGEKVKLSVRDNGKGIPEKIREKIFQPFFTTKPTGEGTGLGLSLSYDIVKAHGGEIKVESKEGEGSVFTVIL